MKLKAAPIFNHMRVWMNARIPVCVHRKCTELILRSLVLCSFMNEGKDSYPFLWIYRPHKAELGILITTQLHVLPNSLWKLFQTAYLRCEFALIESH